MNASYSGFSNISDTQSGNLPAEKPAGTVCAGSRGLRGRLDAFVEKILCMLDAVIGALSTSRSIAVIRVSVSVICFFAIVGIIGGIEIGLISWGAGAVGVLIAAGIEAVCIFWHR